MRFKTIIEVRLRRETTDPESESVKRALQDLSFQVSQVKVAKIYEVNLEASTKKDAETTAKTMCARLLANPSKDEYKIEVEPLGQSRA
jgi:phosphoribosylformylglycinamidine synthase PurS subunit